MLENYEINDETIAIIPINKSVTKIMEEESIYFIKKSPTEVLDDSCKYFGSSYQGRFEGTKSLLGYNYKSPIIVEERKEIIFFPTSSPRLDTCCWISLNKIDKFIKNDKCTKIYFKNGQDYDIDMTYRMFENQVFRATRLKEVLNDRIKRKK